MTATIDLTEASVMTALGDFLTGILGITVVRGQNNQVPMPEGQFVCMTSSGQRNLDTGVRTYVDPGTNPGTKQIRSTKELSVQMDVYGKDSQANATIIATLFRDQYATDAFPGGIAPCYAEDPQQIPLVTGEENWLERWKLDVVMSFVPTVAIGQDFADELEIGNLGNPVTKNTPINPGLPSEAWNGLKPLP